MANKHFTDQKKCN